MSKPEHEDTFLAKLQMWLGGWTSFACTKNPGDKLGKITGGGG